jgi:hypothetical protein
MCTAIQSFHRFWTPGNLLSGTATISNEYRDTPVSLHILSDITSDFFFFGGGGVKCWEKPIQNVVRLELRNRFRAAGVQTNSIQTPLERVHRVATCDLALFSNSNYDYAVMFADAGIQRDAMTSG